VRPGRAAAPTALLVLVLACAGAARAELELIDARLRLDTVWAQGFHRAPGESDSAQRLGILAEPRIEVGLPEGFVARGSLRLRLDALDRLDPGPREPRELWGPTRPVALGSRASLELRELHVSGDLGPVYASVGKQQIVWGIADRIPLLDVVDPYDYREFVLPELSDFRVPLWSALLAARVGPLDVEAIWIPDPSVSVLPQRDGLFRITSPLLIPQLDARSATLRVDPARHPPAKPSNWDYGLRVSGFAGGFDLGASFMHRTEDLPVYAVENLGIGPQGEPRLRVTPEYMQIRQYGLTASRPFGSLTIRAELSYVEGAGFVASSRAASSPPGTRDGFGVSDELEAVIGFDWFGFEDTFVSVQLYPRWILQYEPGFAREELETDVTLRVRRRFLNEALEVGVQWIHNLDRGDGLVRPELAYQWSDRLRLWLGVDVFYGTSRGTFGQYDALDRIVFGARIEI